MPSISRLRTVFTRLLLRVASIALLVVRPSKRALAVPFNFLKLGLRGIRTALQREGTSEGELFLKYFRIQGIAHLFLASDSVSSRFGLCLGFIQIRFGSSGYALLDLFIYWVVAVLQLVLGFLIFAGLGIAGLLLPDSHILARIGFAFLGLVATPVSWIILAIFYVPVATWLSEIMPDNLGSRAKTVPFGLFGSAAMPLLWLGYVWLLTKDVGHFTTFLTWYMSAYALLVANYAAQPARRELILRLINSKPMYVSRTETRFFNIKLVMIIVVIGVFMYLFRMDIWSILEPMSPSILVVICLVVWLGPVMIFRRDLKDELGRLFDSVKSSVEQVHPRAYVAEVTTLVSVSDSWRDTLIQSLNQSDSNEVSLQPRAIGALRQQFVRQVSNRILIVFMGTSVLAACLIYALSIIFVSPSYLHSVGLSSDALIYLKVSALLATVGSAVLALTAAMDVRLKDEFCKPFADKARNWLIVIYTYGVAVAKGLLPDATQSHDTWPWNLVNPPSQSSM